MECRRIIVVTGSVGSGKTTLSQELARILRCRYINLGDYLISKGLTAGIDRRRKSIVVKEGDIIDELKKEDCLIIETIYPNLLSGISPDLIIVLKCDPEKLYRRLKGRYDAEKIIENVEAEVIDTFTIEAINTFGDDKIMEIDTTNITLEDEVKLVLSALNGSVKLPIFLSRGLDIYIKLNSIRRRLLGVLGYVALNRPT